MLDEKQINEALQTVLHPKLKKSLIDIGMIRNVIIKDDVVTINGVPLMVFAPGSATGLIFQTIAQKISDRTKNFGGVTGWKARMPAS